jgi:ubiquitin
MSLHRVRDQFGREFMVEDVDRVLSDTWDRDYPCVRQSLWTYTDWLRDHNCDAEADLMLAEWEVKIGQKAADADTLTRIRKLKEQFQIKDTLRITKQAELDKRRPRLAQMFFENTCGHFYLKATVRLGDIPVFLDELHSQPIVELVIMAETPLATRAATLSRDMSRMVVMEQLQKYMKYRWLRKCVTIELNGFDFEFPALRNIFRESELYPGILRVSGQNLTPPTPDQAKVLPMIAPNLRYLWRLQFGSYTHAYA